MKEENTQLLLAKQNIKGIILEFQVSSKLLNYLKLLV